MDIYTPEPAATIVWLPDELVLHVLSYLEIYDLLLVSRTSHHLRRLSFDPVLHTHRRIRASLTIERAIRTRPSLVELMQHRIYVTRTTVAARKLGRDLIRIKLNRSLLHRPSAEFLVTKGVLPRECLHSRIAPSLISTKRRIEKERVKDVLRNWIAEWGRKCAVNNKRERRNEAAERSKPNVRMLARKFGKPKTGTEEWPSTPRWGSSAAVRTLELPTRGKVLGLRIFWEGLGRSSV